MEKLDSKKIIKEIEKNNQNIKKFSVKKIGLFGSYAKNKQHKKSDIDILVEFDKETFDNYTDLLILLEKIFKRKIDLIIEKDIHPQLKNIKKEVKYVRI
ncbi:nucleotidyltransferase [Candidatus Pacearchaeota archaeon CG10_big_fil_rev_8_21_14_0_10_32_14]|nr:MAG: nucleotidyltransferase [Candidatus Pacearchaeota archaeon CG10_big_fil_rev_8_21_14_0_10_32_14]